MKTRNASLILTGTPAEDGAGVKLTRILGTSQLDHLDPFLLLDEFKSEDSRDYIAGFPPHPHRGFETVTYLKKGNFRHKDSRGNEGLLVPGSVQWMTAGRGIVHSEMPEMKEGLLWGYQLWINLPSHLKMTEPRYQDIPPEKIPAIEDQGKKVKLIAGEFHGIRGPAETFFPVLYLDVELAPETSFTNPVPAEMNCFCYVYEGTLAWAPEDDSVIAEPGRMIVSGEGQSVTARAGSQKTGFLLVAANRIGEPVARAGPFVMNTREQLYQAFADYQSGKLGS